MSPSGTDGAGWGGGNVRTPNEPGQGLSSSGQQLKVSHPGRRDIHHNLLKGGGLLGLSLGMQCYLLAELSRVGGPGPGARDVTWPGGDTGA